MTETGNLKTKISLNWNVKIRIRFVSLTDRPLLVWAFSSKWAIFVNDEKKGRSAQWVVLCSVWASMKPFRTWLWNHSFGGGQYSKSVSNSSVSHTQALIGWGAWKHKRRYILRHIYFSHISLPPLFIWFKHTLTCIWKFCILVHYWALYTARFPFVFMCAIKWQDTFISADPWSTNGFIHLTDQWITLFFFFNIHERNMTWKYVKGRKDIFNLLLSYIDLDEHQFKYWIINSVSKFTSIDVLSNSPYRNSNYWIIYILQWNINAEFHGCRQENKAVEKSLNGCKPDF